MAHAIISKFLEEYDVETNIEPIGFMNELVAHLLSCLFRAKPSIDCNEIENIKVAWMLFSDKSSEADDYSNFGPNSQHYAVFGASTYLPSVCNFGYPLEIIGGKINLSVPKFPLFKNNAASYFRPFSQEPLLRIALSGFKSIHWPIKGDCFSNRLYDIFYSSMSKIDISKAAKRRGICFSPWLLYVVSKLPEVTDFPG